MTLTKDWKNWWTRNYNFLKHATQNVAGDMLVSRSGFEPRGTESRRSTTPSHGNMRLRLSSTETLKRVLVVPPTKIMFYYCHLFSAIPPKKERTWYKLPQKGAYATVLKSRFKKWKAGILSQKMLFPPCVVVDFSFDEEERRYAITRRQRKEHKKGEKLARASQNSPYSNPLCPFFPSSFHSFNLPCGRRDTKTLDLYL